MPARILLLSHVHGTNLKIHRLALPKHLLHLRQVLVPVMHQICVRLALLQVRLDYITSVKLGWVLKDKNPT